MALAFLYALEASHHVVWVDLDAMFFYHGAINALAFTLPGLLAWTLSPVRSQPETCLHPRPE